MIEGKRTMRRSAGAALAGLMGVLAAGPAVAEGPVTPGGVLNTAHDGWSEAVAGENPFTVEEAAATMAFFLRCRDVQNMGDIDAEAFVTDVMAGGLPANGFAEGGAHWDRVQGYYTDFSDYADLAVTMMCEINPYRRD